MRLPALTTAAETDRGGATLIELPDEDRFVMPTGWQRGGHPRRSGAPGPAIVIDGDPVAAIRRLLDSSQHLDAPLLATITQVLGDPKSDRRVEAEAVRYLQNLQNPHGASDTHGTPLGAAAVAGIAAWAVKRTDGRDEQLGTFADAWVATHGVVFAARAVAELAGLDNRSCRYIEPYDVDVSYGGWWRIGWEPIAEQVRAHLVAASDAEYDAACNALAGYRNGLLCQRIATSYLVPTQTGWVDADCDALATTHAKSTDHLLLCAVGSLDQLESAISNVQPAVSQVLLSAGVLATLVDEFGPAVAPALAKWFDRDISADVKRQFLAILGRIPTDQAFELLLERLDQTYVPPAVLEAARRYPVRALRLLPAAAGSASASGRTAAGLLRAHIAAHMDLAAGVLPSLPEEVQERVDAVVKALAAIAEAPPELLPGVLVTPPWTVTQERPKPTVIAGLTPPNDVTVTWVRGEREAWAAILERTWAWFGRNGLWRSDWARVANACRNGSLVPSQMADFFARAPEELARPLLGMWRPTPKDDRDRLKPILARFELAALPGALESFGPPGDGSELLPFASTQVAALMADALVRLKSLRATALAWLGRHPTAAARALVPAVLGKPVRERRAAEAALRAIVASGHWAEVVDAAGGYGPKAAAAIEGFLATDPLELLPAKIPALPDWVEPRLCPPVLLRDRTHALPQDAVLHLCMMLVISKPDEVYAGIDAVTAACDRESLAEFGWGLFRQWQTVGAPPSDRWVLDALGWIGDDETVRRLAPFIKAWPAQPGQHPRAVQALDVLVGIGSDVALIQLNRVAQKVKQKALRERAAEKIAAVAAERGLTAAELADRLVPDLGLDPDGSLLLDYGSRRFRVGFDEQLKPYVADEDGTPRKDLPKPGARDDEQLAPAAYKQYAALKKDVRAIAGDQIHRLEHAMVAQRRWTGKQFRELFVAHPLLWHLVRRLVWATFDSDGTVKTALRVAEDRTFVDGNDDAITVCDDDVVGIVHPVHVEHAIAKWSEVFANHQIRQPFPQLNRGVHRLTAEEIAANRLRRTGITVPTGNVLRLERRGWRRGDPEEAGVQYLTYRELPGGSFVVASLSPGISVTTPTDEPAQELTDIWISNHPYGGGLHFGDLDPVTASEVLRDLSELAN